MLLCVLTYSQSWTPKGYVESYYAFSCNKPVDEIEYSLNFDKQNEFAVNMAMIGASHRGEFTRANFGLQAGTAVENNYASEPVGFRYVNEANAGVKVAKDLWLDAGIFQSSFGTENSVGFDNLALTLSMTAESSPSYQAGARISYERDRFTATAYLLNGWQVISDNNGRKSLATQLQFKPTPNSTFNLSTFYGDTGNSVDSIESVPRLFNDFFYTCRISDIVSMGFVLDVGIQGDSAYVGETLTLQIRSGANALTLREDYMYDKSRIVYTYAPMGYRVAASSVTLERLISNNAKLRFEAKYLDAAESVFSTPDGSLSSTAFVFTGAVSVKF
jgi:hypothetical protein